MAAAAAEQQYSRSRLELVPRAPPPCSSLTHPLSSSSVVRLYFLHLLFYHHLHSRGFLLAICV